MARREIESTGDAAFGECGQQRRCGPVENQHGLVKARRVEGGGDAGYRRQRPHQGLRALAAGGRDALEPLGSEQRQIDGRRSHQKSLVGADVGRGLAAPDVLLPRLQRQREARAALGIDGAAYDTPGHLAYVREARRHEAEIRAAGRERYAERLSLAAYDIGAALAALSAPPLSRRLVQR